MSKTIILNLTIAVDKLNHSYILAHLFYSSGIACDHSRLTSKIFIIDHQLSQQPQSWSRYVTITSHVLYRILWCLMFVKNIVWISPLWVDWTNIDIFNIISLPVFILHIFCQGSTDLTLQSYICTRLEIESGSYKKIPPDQRLLKMNCISYLFARGIVFLDNLL